MKIIIPFCLLAFVFSSCLIHIVSGNDYKHLHPSYKAIISKLTSFDSVENRKIYEINGLQLREELAKHDSALVYFYFPRCTGPACVPLSFYDNYAKEHQLKLFIVATTFSGIEENYMQPFEYPLFAVDADYYGVNKYRKYNPAFKKDLLSTEEEVTSKIFVFHKDSLARTMTSLENI